jgi:hypothetical protein
MALLLDSFLMSSLSGIARRKYTPKYTTEKLFLKRFSPAVSGDLA